MLKQLVDIYELLDAPRVDGARVAEFFKVRGADVTVEPITHGDRHVDFVRLVFPGRSGKLTSGSSPTLGIIGRLGGLGIRPMRLGLVSDADGALAALTCAAKLAAMRADGDVLDGDVLITTTVSNSALVERQDRTERVSSAVPASMLLEREVDSAMDAILSIDTTRGNRLLNAAGVALTPTVKQGFILRVSEPLLDVLEHVTGLLPLVLPITNQDITPYEDGLYQINSIMQPAVYTNAPVVGVALTSVSRVPGSATGASQFSTVEAAARFCLEVGKAFTARELAFDDPVEWQTIRERYSVHLHDRSLYARQQQTDGGLFADAITG